MSDKFYVDVPCLKAHNTDALFGEYEYLDQFDTWDEALEWCKEMFGCDDEGKVQLITREAHDD